ncbi:DUF4428 domain-containing protein [Sporomusa termitida]|nr:DUF4428 domain-containing protein [Sporomusa termitida]
MNKDVDIKEREKHICYVCKKKTALLPLEDGIYICNSCAQVMAEMSPS